MLFENGAGRTAWQMNQRQNSNSDNNSDFCPLLSPA